MNDAGKNDQTTEDDASWLDKVSKPLIIVGALAFGLIISDRVEDMLEADDQPDLPDVVEIDRDASLVADIEAPDVSASSGAVVATGNNAATNNNQPDIEEVFGARLVLVSESNDPYVVTADDRRIAVGDSVDDQTTLAGISRGRVIVDKSGGLITFELPEPKLQ